MKAGVMAVAHGGHWLALGKKLGVRADPDFQVLGPKPFLYQKLFQGTSLLASWFQLVERLSNGGDYFISNGGRLLRVAAGLLFNYAFQQADRKSNTSRFDSLQIDGGKQPGLPQVALIG